MAKPIKNFICCLLIVSVSLVSSNLLIAQSVPLKSSVHANFGVDADIKSGIVSFDIAIPGVDTDDWFVGDSGLGVIDVTDAAKIAQLAAGDNIGVEFRMSEPVYTVVNGDTWIDAVFIRDQHTTGGNKDINVFGASSDKNYRDPTTWTLKNGDVPQKNDIIDVYAHLRRDSDAVFPNNDDQWAFVAASTRSPNGTSYLDFEYFRTKVTYDAVNFKIVTGGLECGHTAYEFDAAGGIGSGAVITHGDVILSTNYTNGGSAADVRLYAWIDISDFPNGNADFALFNAMPFRPFDFGDENGNLEFHRCNNDNNIPYGYARISLRSDITGEAAIFAQVNTAGNSVAPTWGTIAPNGSVTPNYIMPTFAEFAINSTLLGFDTRTTTGDCQAPLGSVIVKTRSSDSFTAELKDMAGPFDLGDTPEYTVTIAKSGDLDCIVNEVTLTADPAPPGTYKYEWYKNDAIIPGTDPDSPTLIVTEPGMYKVMATVQIGGEDGCTAESTEIEVLQDNTPPGPPTTGGDERCGPGDVTLTASCTSGTITWYDAAVDGNVVDVGGDGSSYTVNLATTTSFWVTCSTADQNGCESERVEVTGVVTPLTPDYSDTQIVCDGGSYTWMIDTDGDGATEDYTVSTETTETFNVFDVNGCPYDLNLTLVYYDVTADIDDSQTVCEGGSYTWSIDTDGDGATEDYTVSTETTETFNVFDVNGCPYDLNLTLVYYDVTADIDDSQTVCEGGSYTWSIDTDGDGATEDYTVSTETTETFNVFDVNGCPYDLNLTLVYYDVTADIDDSQTVCEGGSYTWSIDTDGDGATEDYTVSTETTETFNVFDVNGCPYDLNLTLVYYDVTADIDDGQTVCEGGSYTWSIDTDGDGATEDYTVSTETTETFNVFDVNGCPYDLNLTLVYYDVTADIDDSQTVCEGGSYTWSIDTDGDGATEDYTVSTETTETFNVFDVNGCPYDLNLTLVYYDVTADIDDSQTVCEGGSYTWSIDTDGDGATEDYTVSTETTETFNVFDVNGCPYDLNLTLVYYDVTADIDDSQTVCEGGSYTWSIDTDGDGATEDYTVSTETTETFNVFDVNGCPYDLNLTLVYYDVTTDIDDSQTVCEGGSYTWSIDTDGDGATEDYTVSTETTETFNVFDVNGCPYDLNLTLVYYDVTADIDDGQTVCEGGSYTWSIDTDGDGATEDYTVSTETTETFNVFDVNGCPYDLNLTLVYYDVTADIDDSQTVCEGGSYTWSIDTDGDGATEDYTVSTETTETFNVFDVNGCPYDLNLTLVYYDVTADIDDSQTVCEGGSYTWSIDTDGDGATEDYTVSTETTETFNVFDVNGCPYDLNLTLVYYDVTADIDDSQTVCEGGSYTWSIDTDGDGATEDYTVSTETTETFNVFDVNGCPYDLNLTLVYYDVTDDISDTQTVCDGGSYTWKIDTDGDGITETYTVSSETTETFNVFDANGCPYDLILTLDYILSIPCNITGDSDVCLENSHIYSAPAGDYNYSWLVTGATIIGASDEQTVTVQPDAEGTFNIALTLTSINLDCTNSCNMDVTVYDCCKEETAFAYNTTNAGIDNLCFLDTNDPNVLTENRWGWTLDNLDLTDISDDLSGEYNSYTFDMYAGNGGGSQADCDPTDGPGELVGTVTISRDGDDIIITYDLLDPTDTYYYSLDGLHVNLGCNQFPIKKKGRNWYNTTAPGQYNVKGNANGENMAVLTVSASEIGCLDDLYAIFHAEVNICRFEPTVNSSIASIPTAPLTNEVKDKSLNVKAYPVPFKDKVTIEYNFDFETDVTIEVVDLRGRVFETITNKRYSKNTVDKVVLDMSRMQDQVFFVRISTNNGSIIKQIVSDNKK